MKRLLLIFAVVLSANLVMADHYYMIPLKSGKELKGSFVSMTDSTATFKGKDGQEFVVKLSDFDQIYDYSSSYYLVDGKIISIYSAEGTAYRRSKNQQQRVETMAAKENTDAEVLNRPNLSIGQEIKRAGGACIGAGAPLLLGGLVLTIYGSKTPSLSLSNLDEYNDKVKTKDACKTAGVVLLSVGGALTIAGIPILIEGRKIMDIELQYTGMGAGVAVKW